MTRLELIKLIGDLLTKIDVLRGSLIPDSPNRSALDHIRKSLDKKQLVLSQNQFDDNTQEYIDAAKKLEDINREVKKTISKIEKLVETIENLKRLVGAVENIIKVAIPFE